VASPEDEVRVVKVDGVIGTDDSVLMVGMRLVSELEGLLELTDGEEGA